MSLKSKKIINFFVSATIVSIIVLPTIISAAGDIAVDNPLKVNTIAELIDLVISKVLMPIGAVVAVVMIIFSGFLYVTARGNKEQIKKAHDSLLWSVLGACLLLGSLILSKAIQSTIAKFQ